MFACCFKPSAADKYLEDAQDDAAKVATPSNQKTTGANAHATSETADTATDTSSKPEAQVDMQPKLELKTVTEPQRSELLSYAWQRREHLNLFMTPADVKSEMTRQVMEKLQQIDLYPRGRQLIDKDEEYVIILRDLLNLGVILDDMEQTGWVPYSHRTAYYNLYAKIYRALTTRAASNSKVSLTSK